MRKRKLDWLNEGLRILAESGVQELTIDRLTARLGVTKGSFYHHFQGQQGYKLELLTYVESVGTTAIIAAVDQAKTPEDRLYRLLEAVPFATVSYERAIRAWSLQDNEVLQFQQRIDQRRLEYTFQLCHDLLPDADEARTLANTLYAVLIGCEQMYPTFDVATVHHLLISCVRRFTR